MKTDGQLIAERLKFLTEQRSMSINKLAIMANMNQSTLYSLYDGTSQRPTISTIRSVCDGLGISVHEFFDFSPYNQLIN